MTQLYTLFYKLLTDTIPRLRRFPKDQRYILASQIEKAELHSLVSAQLASLEPDRRIELLKEINRELVLIRTLWTLSKDLGFVSYGTYMNIMENIDRIGKKVGVLIKNNASSSNQPKLSEHF